MTAANNRKSATAQNETDRQHLPLTVPSATDSKDRGKFSQSVAVRHSTPSMTGRQMDGREEGKRRRPATGDTLTVAMTGALTARLFLIGTPSPPLLGGQVCGDGVCVRCVNGAAWFSPSQV